MYSSGFITKVKIKSENREKHAAVQIPEQICVCSHAIEICNMLNQL